MNKEAVYALLRAQGIPFEVTEHGAVYTMAELKDVPLPYPEADAKNIFVRDDKKRQYYLLTGQGDKRVDLKAFRRAHGTRPLTCASAEELLSHLGLTPGAVSPMGLLNDASGTVAWYVDEALLAGRRIGLHPNDNTATVWMPTQAMIDLARAHGNPVEVFSPEQ